ncbi:MAG TPA: long-chain fatty acid--CoA ligase [Desulfomonilaceae bacterium]|nr:long-chain fatty acid--CoA ligase [Desulfomonilaceae bacterium]
MEKIWLKSYHSVVPGELEFENITLPEALTRSAGRFPGNPALIFQGKIITYKQLDEMASKFASALVALGVKPGDKVSLLLPNLVQMVVATYGAFRAGAVVVMNNPLYTDRELQHQFNDSESTFLISLDLLVPRMIKLREKTGITKIVCCHIRDYLPFPLKQLFPFVKKTMHRNMPAEKDVYEFTGLIKQHGPIPRPATVEFDDTAALLYTGGTTGVSKGVQLTHGNLSCNVQQCGAWFPDFKPGKEVVIGALPFFHSFGMTTAMNIAIYYGYADVLIAKPEPKAILEAISKYKATYMPAVPTLYNGMINFRDLKKYDLTSLTGCFSGGAPLPLETLRNFEKLTGSQICEGYGLTETSPVTHINPYGAKTKAGSIGVPVSNTDAKIVDVDDYAKEITAPGESGELCLKGPQIMKGYINRPEETAITLKDGWLLTGDIAVCDEDGYFSIVDRKKDMIISGGFNIYPRDVDEVLFSHAKVLEACVIGVPDQYSGERIKAFVVLKEGESATPEEIIQYCAENLVKYKVPKYVEFVPELPKSAVGKILRKELRQLDQEKAEQK